MFGRINKTKKSFITAVGMSLVLLMASAFGILIDTKVGQITKPIAADTWDKYAVRPAGSGESQSDPFRITTPQELAYLINIPWDKVELDEDDEEVVVGYNTWYAELQNDIDLSGHEWKPIQRTKTSNGFLNLDGKNYCIANMTINRPNEDNVGFMQSGSVCQFQNLNFSNVDIYGRDNVGTLFGAQETSTFVMNISVLSGIVRGRNNVGGVIGCQPGFLTNMLNNAKIIATGNYVGGIAGYGFCTYSNCISTGDIIGNNYVGGIAGVFANGYSFASSCYVECTITAGNYVGGFFGTYDTTYESVARVRDSGFNGEIISNSSTPTKIGAFVGDLTHQNLAFENCFGVAEIQLLNSDNADAVNAFGVPTLAEFASTYAYSKVYTTTGKKEYRKYKVGTSETQPFKDMVYHKNINGGYPFPKSLFAVGRFIECDTMSYLEEYGFYSKPILGNDSYYDYVLLGEYPQTFVGEEMNAKLEDWYTEQTPIGNYQKYAFTDDSNLAYKYTDGFTYVRVANPNYKNLTYTFEDGTIVANYYNKATWFKVEPIKWWIWREGENLELVPEKALMAMTFQAFNNGVNVPQPLTWFNNKFYNDAFSSGEKSLLLLGDGERYVTSWRGGGPSVPTYCAPTDYSLAHGCELVKGDSYVTIDRPGGGRCSWFTGDTFITGYGDGQNRATYVSAAGTWNNVLASTIIGVRPYIEIANVKNW